MTINFLTSKTRQKNHLQFSQRELVIVFCALLALGVRLIFPVKLAGEWFWLNLILFFVFPSLIILFLLKEKPADFGLTLGNYKIGVALAVLLVTLFSAFNYIAILKTDQWKNFYIYPPIAENFWTFLWFQLVVSNIVFFSREFFFRGFLLFGLKKMAGWWIIPVQAFLYSLLFAKYSWVLATTAFVSAIFAGLVAKKTNSIYYSFLSLWLISITADIMIIKFVLS